MQNLWQAEVPWRTLDQIEELGPNQHLADDPSFGAILSRLV
jgi:hypothetical protein